MAHTHLIRANTLLVMLSILKKHPLSESQIYQDGDMQVLKGMISFMELNPDILRLRSNLGEPVIDWSPLHLSHPHRVFTTNLRYGIKCEVWDQV
jgi:hypothetical protein